MWSALRSLDDMRWDGIGIFNVEPMEDDVYTPKYDHYYDWDEDRYWDIDTWSFLVDDVESPYKLNIERMNHFGGSVRVITYPVDYMGNNDSHFQRDSQHNVGTERYMEETLDWIRHHPNLSIEDLDRRFPTSDWYDSSSDATRMRLGLEPRFVPSENLR